jgi:tetratricopeptide (TPR) repeat protein
MVITGQMLNLDSMFRYRTNAINVETAVRASVTRLDVRSDNATRRMFAAIARQQNTVKAAKYGVSADVTPQTAGTFLDRGIMFASRGEFEMAIADFDEAIRINPNMSAAYALRARALYASVSRIIGIGENFSGVVSFTTGGQTTSEQRRIYERAVADFTQAIRLDPNNAKIYNERGGVYDNMGDFDRAFTDFTQAIRLDPNYAIAYSNRALVYVHMGDLDRAIADYNQAIRLDSNHHAAYDGRAEAYYFMRDYDRAIADFTQAVRLNPNHPESYEGRGLIYLITTDDYDRAILDFTEVIRLKPNFSNAYWGRGQAFFLKRDYDRAIADYNQAIRFDPNHTTSYHYRGMAYANKGDFDRAIADWEAVLRIDPNYPNARQNIENARRERGR